MSDAQPEIYDMLRGIFAVDEMNAPSYASLEKWIAHRLADRGLNSVLEMTVGELRDLIERHNAAWSTAVRAAGNDLWVDVPVPRAVDGAQT